MARRNAERRQALPNFGSHSTVDRCEDFHAAGRANEIAFAKFNLVVNIRWVATVVACHLPSQPEQIDEKTRTSGTFCGTGCVQTGDLKRHGWR
jgi:hypothetical protein